MNNYNALINNLEELGLNKIRENLDDYLDLISDGTKTAVDAIYELSEMEIKLRKEHGILVYGDLKPITLCDSEDVISYTRSYKGETWLIINNFSDKEITLSPVEYNSVIFGNNKFKENSISPSESVILKI